MKPALGTCYIINPSADTVSQINIDEKLAAHISTFKKCEIREGCTILYNGKYGAESNGEPESWTFDHDYGFQLGFCGICYVVGTQCVSEDAKLLRYLKPTIHISSLKKKISFTRV
jgi:hypothetical protein